MKKLFLLVAFTGIVGAASAVTVNTLSKATVITVGDDKKDEKKKACCKKGETAKACSGEKTEGKTCSHEGKACCKSKATASATPAATPSTTPAVK